MPETIYLDHNATTPLLPEVAEAMLQCYRGPAGNPSSQHSAGRRARAQLEDSRERIAEILGARLAGDKDDRLIITSCGTEANNLALFGMVGQEPGHLVVSMIEHPSVMGAVGRLSQQGWHVDLAPVNRHGAVDVDRLTEMLRPNTRLVSLQLGNNETGVIQPVAEVAELCGQRGIPLHTDAAQVIGKRPVDFRALGAAAMTVAPHKFHGPIGIGALLVRHDVPLEPLLVGGHQQQGVRPGTEPVPLVVGMLAALEAWHRDQTQRQQHLAELRDHLEQTLQTAAPEIVVHGITTERLPNTSNLGFPGVDRQAMLMALDMAGVACSIGSACASGSSDVSPTLAAMGADPEVLRGSLRFSVGVTTTLAEVSSGASRILQVYNELRGDKSRRKIGSDARGAPRLPV